MHAGGGHFEHMLRNYCLFVLCGSSEHFTQLEAIASAEYWIRFMVRFDGVHAFGYNSAESEPIWMKF